MVTLVKSQGMQENVGTIKCQILITNPGSNPELEVLQDMSNHGSNVENCYAREEFE